MKHINKLLNRTTPYSERQRTRDGFITNGVIAIREELVDLADRTKAAIKNSNVCIADMLAQKDKYVPAITTPVIYEDGPAQGRRKFEELRILLAGHVFIAARKDIHDELLDEGFSAFAQVDSCEAVLYVRNYSICSWPDALLMPWIIAERRRLLSIDLLIRPELEER